MPQSIGVPPRGACRLGRAGFEKLGGGLQTPAPPWSILKKEICLLESSGGTGWRADDRKGNGAGAAMRRPFSARSQRPLHMLILTYLYIFIFSYFPVCISTYDHMVIFI